MSGHNIDCVTVCQPAAHIIANKVYMEPLYCAIKNMQHTQCMCNSYISQASCANNYYRSMLAMLDSLSQQHYDTIAHSLRTALTTNSAGIEYSGLSRQKFKTLLAKTMSVKEQDKSLALICKKVHNTIVSLYTDGDIDYSQNSTSSLITEKGSMFPQNCSHYIPKIDENDLANSLHMDCHQYIFRNVFDT